MSTVQGSAVPLNGLAKAGFLTEFLRDTFALADVELRKLRRDPLELLTRAIQPALWLLIFGQVFGKVKAVPTGELDYVTFMVPGILAQSVLFIAIFYGISVIWERDLGILQKLLVSPAPRTALVLGKALSAGVRGLSQAIVIYLLASLLRVRLRFGIGLLGVLAFVVLGSAIFSTFSLAVALPGENPGKVHGYWTGPHHATLFCQQRHLSASHHAPLVTDFCQTEPAQLSGRCPSSADGSRRSDHVRFEFRFLHTGASVGGFGSRNSQALPQCDPVSL